MVFFANRLRNVGANKLGFAYERVSGSSSLSSPGLEQHHRASLKAREKKALRLQTIFSFWTSTNSRTPLFLFFRLFLFPHLDFPSSTRHGDYAVPFQLPYSWECSRIIENILSIPSSTFHLFSLHSSTHSTSLKMPSVLMVCLGNICRSPMAEAVLQDIVNKRGYKDFKVDSAGTAGCELTFMRNELCLLTDSST